MFAPVALASVRRWAVKYFNYEMQSGMSRFEPRELVLQCTGAPESSPDNMRFVLACSRQTEK
jgi:hypothetical protein